ncbi:MAG: hypothetical protein J6S60_05860 [Oscillospiraceae bacterium]|nr:hypothetical protein [Oscillospiraceae bacterium]
MKNLFAFLLALIMLAAPVLAWADDDPVIKDPEAEIDAAMSFSFDASDETTDDPEVKARGIAAVQATTCSDLVVLPQDGSWLKEWKTGYARKAFKAPCLRVERISQLHTGRDVMPYIYEGTEATVLAEENNMSLIIYRGSDDRFYTGWIQSIRILDDFPGDLYTIGNEPSGDLSFRDDIGLDWSRCSWLNTQQNYTVLSEEVKNCIGFTLDYQIIAENTDVWQNILGPRKVYVKTGGEWLEVGEFPYPDFGAVKVQVWLDHPMDIDAVGTIAQCRLPNTFWFRQVVTDFASPTA